MTDPAAPLFSFRGVRVERGGRTALEVDSLTIPDGRSTVIIGPSGSGKSTLLRLCNQLVVPATGTVLYRGAALGERTPMHHRRDVAMVFQRPIALDGSVFDNLREAAPSVSTSHASVLLERVGLDPAIIARPAADLSGGELQRLSIARCLATEPTVLLLDEATSALDPANTHRVEALVSALAESGITPIWVTHQPEQMQRVAEQVVVVMEGTVQQAGPADEVLGSPTPSVERFLAGTLE